MKSGQREYLTEVSLGQFLRERVDATFVANQPVRDLGRRFRPDYHNEGLKLVVEFDGDQHYRSSRVILGDLERDAFFTACDPHTLLRPVEPRRHHTFVWRLCPLNRRLP
jgi:very-short-patch-repair endonuclease